MSKRNQGTTPVLLWIIRILIVVLFCVAVAIVANRLVEYHQKNKAPNHEASVYTFSVYSLENQP